MLKTALGVSIASTYILMVMGNIVTTTESGLACPDWPLCYGTVVPPREISIWIEWTHRLLGGLTGFLILISVVLAWKTTTGAVKWLTTAAIVLLPIGATFGGIIVLIEAPLLRGAIDLLVISSHLIIATLIFTSMIFAYRLYTTDNGATAPASHPVFPILFGIVFVQVLIGIFVRYGQATLACPDFPLCRGALFPDLVDFKVTIHFIHRVMATIIFLTITGYAIQAARSGRDKANAFITLGLVILQATFGAFVVWTGMYFPFVVLHGATGFGILGWLAYRSAPDVSAMVGLTPTEPAPQPA